MHTILIIANPSKEYALFRQVFLKLSFSVVFSQPTYASYLKTLQYSPEVVLMELPGASKEHLTFLKIIRSNKGISQIPFVFFGPPLDPRILEYMASLGFTNHFPVPFNVADVIKRVLGLLKKKEQQQHQQATAQQADHRRAKHRDNDLIAQSIDPDHGPLSMCRGQGCATQPANQSMTGTAGDPQPPSRQIPNNGSKQRTEDG